MFCICLEQADEGVQEEEGRKTQERLAVKGNSIYQQGQEDGVPYCHGLAEDVRDPVVSFWPLVVSLIDYMVVCYSLNCVFILEYVLVCGWQIR